MGGSRSRTATGADPARLAALEVLRDVRVDDAYANLALPAALRRHSLTGRDAAFATELVAGTLRGRGTYETVLAACIDRPLAKVQHAVLDALLLGVHQLLATRVPAHAAISTTVDLVRSRSGQRAGGFANAVLRRVAAHDLAAWVEQLAPAIGKDRHGHLAVAHSHPRWVVDRLGEALAGVGAGAELPDLLAADNTPPDVVLVARPGRVDRAELPGEPTRLSPFGTRLAGGDPGAVPQVADGRAGVQDEGSQLVALALARAELDGAELNGADARWLDLCAGPGGKAALLAGLAAQQGAGLLAAEVQPPRAGLVARSLRQAEGVLGVVCADGTMPPWRAETFDRVLVDAPCTGLGALRRRPEARWRRRETDLADLVPLQRRLLSAAVTSTRPGGLVLYATCSPVLAETAEVVTAVVDERADLTLVDLSTVLPDVSDAAGPLPGTLQLWPHRHDTDAMFMALLQRR